VDSVFQYGGLLEFDLVLKLISFGANGISIFKGVKSGVTTQLREKFAPYMVEVPCAAHQTNLTIQTLSKLPLVSKIEAMLQSIYTYYFLSSQQHLNRCKLEIFLEQKALKILCNVKHVRFQCS
jgi:hypothetical protein